MSDDRQRWRRVPGASSSGVWLMNGVCEWDETAVGPARLLWTRRPPQQCWSSPCPSSLDDETTTTVPHRRVISKGSAEGAWKLSYWTQDAGADSAAAAAAAVAVPRQHTTIQPSRTFEKEEPRWYATRNMGDAGWEKATHACCAYRSALCPRRACVGGGRCAQGPET